MVNKVLHLTAKNVAIAFAGVVTGVAAAAIADEMFFPRAKSGLIFKLPGK